MWSEECSLEMLTLDYDLPEDFFQFVWDASGQLTLLFVMFQRILSLYYSALAVSWLTFIVDDEEFSNYMAYFDYWALVISEVTSAFWLLYLAKRHNSEGLDYMPWYIKAKWVLFSAALPSTFLACIAYWTLVYPKISHPMCMITNITSPIAIVVHFLLAAFPLRLLHFYFFVIFYLIYIIFTAAHQWAGGTGLNDTKYIYHSLDWSHPEKAFLTSFIGLMIGLCVYFLFCFISRGKMWYRENYVS